MTDNHFEDSALVADLRRIAGDQQDGWTFMLEAADKIERLSAAGDALAAAVDKLDGFITSDKAVASEVEQTLRAWQETRRG